MIYEPNQIACARCKREYSLRLGEEPTLFCDACAHEIADVAWQTTPPTYREVCDQRDRAIRLAAIPTDAENRFREALAKIAYWPEGGAKGDRPDLMRELARAALAGETKG